MTRGRKYKAKGPKKRNDYRPINSYRAKTSEAKEKQMAGLRQYSGKSKPKDPNAPAPLKQADLMKADIIEFAVKWLGVSFEERPAQEVILRSLYGLPLDKAQVALYCKLTTNEEVFEADIEKTDADLAIGARGGKSLMVSIIALFESIVRAVRFRKYLRKDEKGYAVITATRQKQCEDIVQASCATLLTNSSLSYLIDDREGGITKSELTLTNGMVIMSMPCNSTAGRGMPIFLLIFDEIAHYRVEGVRADQTIFDALHPRQAQFAKANPKCLKISTPAGKQGLFWDEFSEGFKVPGRLTIQGHTRLVNPMIEQAWIDKEYKRDDVYASREYGARFAETISSFFETCQKELAASFDEKDGDIPYLLGRKYYGSIDQSGLSGGDRFSFAICHYENRVKKVKTDICREWSDTKFDMIRSLIKELCVGYHIDMIQADRYAKGYIIEAFDKIGIKIEIRELLPAIYPNFRTLIKNNKMSMPDRKTLRDGLFRTQGVYGKSQTLSIQRERSSEGHGDIADAVVDAAFQCDLTVSDITPVLVYSDAEEDDGWDEWRD